MSDEGFSVAQVAASAGVTARTLRHYDNIALLRADRDPSNGYRIYRRRHLLRLQRILLLRKIGMSLAAITDMLDHDHDDVAALRTHLSALRAERDRIDRMIATVQRTLGDGDGADLTPERLFDGFAQRRDAFAQRLIERFGEDVRRHFDHADAVTADWDDHARHRAAVEGTRLLTELSRLRWTGTAPDAPQVAPLVATHRAAVGSYWDVTDSAYHALADLLVDDPDQRAIIDRVDPDLAPWLRDAIHAHTMNAPAKWPLPSESQRCSVRLRRS